MKKTINLFLFFFVISLIPLNAQYQGKIEGVVKDKDGTLLKGVEIHLIYTKSTSRNFKLKTNDQGKFTQIGMYPGYYQMNIKHPSYAPLSREVRIRIAETTELEILLDKAEKAMERALSEADKLFMNGYKLYEQQKYDEAITTYYKAIELNPDQWGYYFNLGLVYKKQKDLEKAINAFTKAAELNPESYTSNKELAESLALSQKFEEAKPLYEKIVEMNQDDPNTFYNYGAVLSKVGDSEQALQAFLKAIKIKEDYADAYYQAGTIFVGQNNKPEAIRHLEKFLELAPDHEQAGIARQLIDFLKQ